jgi:hypothetical protein
MMFIITAGMWRALSGFRLNFRRRGPKMDVFVVHHKVRDGSKLYFLFTDMPPQHQLGTLVSKLSDMHCVVGGSIDIEPRRHYVVVEWAPFGTWEREEHLIADIRLTVFEILLGTYEPHFKSYGIMRSDLEGEVRRLGRENNMDWAGELRLQMS